MQFALEVRCPLLDVRLARFAAGLPARFCHDGRQTKIILKKLAARYLPDDIINRPKMGFGLPDRTWAQDGLLSLAHDMLLGPGSRVGARVHRKGLHEYLERQRNPNCFSVYQVWNLLILEQWLRGPVPAAQAIPARAA
jgi:asparagine synthase (glutamine-hydrolysing)